MSVAFFKEMGTGKSRLSSHTVQKLQCVTYFSAGEIQEWYKAFCKECPSGQMNLNQFLTVWQDLFVSSDRKLVFDDDELQNYGKQVFRLIDKDGSGTIDFREFLMNLSIETRGTLEQKLEQVFSLYDLDKNGYVTKSEMHEFIKLVNKAVDFGGSKEHLDPEDLAEKLAHKIFWKLDRNKDGKLTMFEFISGVRAEPCLVDYFLGNSTK